MFCLECGKELPDDARFCSSCGFALKSNKLPSKNVNKERALTKEEKALKKISDNSYYQEFGKDEYDYNRELKSSNSFSNNENSITAGKAVLIVIGVIFACAIIGSLFSGGSDTAEVLYSGCWSGAFDDGDSIISIDGCGNASFDCGGGYCGINAQKQEDNSLELCVKIGSDQACTTAEYGIAQV